MPVDAVPRIAAAVTPAVMVSACGLIALGLDNQAARVSGRLREMAREHRGLDPSSPLRATVEEQIRVLGRRHMLYTRALLLNYSALLAFVLTSLLYLVARLPAAAPMAAFTAGVVMLGLMALYVLASLRLARSALRLEQARTLSA